MHDDFTGEEITGPAWTCVGAYRRLDCGYTTESDKGIKDHLKNNRGHRAEWY